MNIQTNYKINIYTSYKVFLKMLLNLITKAKYPHRRLYFNNLWQFSQTSQQLNLNHYLLQRLKSRKLYPLKDFQIESFIKVDKQSKNVFINSCTGSGKTLAYLLPILNSILNQKQQRSTNKNTNQVASLYENNQKHGALILTLNKQLALQIYKDIRLIDVDNKLNTYRIGPISHYAPVIQLLNTKQKNPQDQEMIADEIEKNITKCIDWTKTDILIATPQMFWNIMTSMVQSKTNLINPQFIAIDQADLLLQIDQNVSNFTNKILTLAKQKKIPKQKNLKSFFAQEDKEKVIKTKFLMSSSSVPKKIKNMPYKDYFSSNFKPIEVVTGINKHRLPQRLQLKFIQIGSTKSAQEIFDQKIYYLSKILCDPQKKGDRFIIFCSNRANVTKIAQFLLTKLQKQSIQYYASLPSDQRSLNIYKFMNENFDILISTDLGSRGLHFNRPIHTIIQFDMAENIVNFINRAGRAARNQLPGQVITFVQQKSKQFFKHLSQISANDQQFDQLFSRKRSYSKLLYKYNKSQSQGQTNTSKQ